MYKPYGKDVKCYDVNGLYPATASMKNVMPTAFPASLLPQNNEYIIKQFEGNILSLWAVPDAFGYFLVDVICPDTLDKPLLPVKFDTGNGERSIYPTGT